MADKNESATVKEEKNEASGSQAEASSSTSQSSGKSDNLEDLFLTLKHQLSNSDWLEKNTAEKWVAENPETAKAYMEAVKKS